MVEWDFEFLQFCLKDDFRPLFIEIWRKCYNSTYKFFIPHLHDWRKAGFVLGIMKKFLFYDSIQKNVLVVNI